jgi:hypothetical protein
MKKRRLASLLKTSVCGRAQTPAKTPILYKVYNLYLLRRLKAQPL